MRARLVLSLRRRGYSLERIRKIATGPITGRYGLVWRGGVVWCQTDKETLATASRAPWQCFVVDVADLRKGLDRWMQAS